MKTGSCRYNIRIGYGHTSSCHPLLLHYWLRNRPLEAQCRPTSEFMPSSSGALPEG